MDVVSHLKNRAEFKRELDGVPLDLWQKLQNYVPNWHAKNLENDT